MTLKQRFELFLTGLQGCESIDALLHGSNITKKRADYLLASRAVIIEQKTLEVDPETKASQFFRDLIKRERIVVLGRVGLNQILGLPGIEWVIGEIIAREKLVDSGLSAL